MSQNQIFQTNLIKTESVLENEEFQNKSLQGNIFCQSRTHFLKGDEDQIHFSVSSNAKDAKEKILVSQEQFQINDQNLDACDDIDKTQENFQVELSIIEKSRTSSNRQQGESKYFQEKDVNKTNQQPLISDIIQFRGAQQNKRRQSIENYEKASQIINKALGKSLNRVQRINKLVKNFIYMLKIRKNNRSVMNLQENEYKLINDLAYFFHPKPNNFIVNYYFYKLINLSKIGIQVPQVFMPTNTFRVYWDILQTIYTYLFIFIYSILIFFAMKEQDSFFVKQYYKFTFIVFLVDVLITLNTAFFKQDVVITNRKKIAWKYVTSSIFITDAICLITMGSKLISMNSNLVYNPDHSLQSIAINSLVFLKLKCLSQKKKRFSQAFILNDNQKHIMKLLNQLFSVIFVAHFVSLAWNILGKYENQNGYSSSWIKKYNFDELTYLQLYIYCMYWSVTTMTTVGYGDISASNYVEALFISISMILFSCVFAYSINNIGFILQEIEKSSKELNDSIIVIQRYLKRKNVNSSLKSRVRHYLCFLAKEQKDRDTQSEQQILQILSNKLRSEIVIEVNSRILKNNSIFTANFSSQTLRKLIFLMEEVIVSPNEIIFEQGDSEDQSIYFIESGQIEIYQSVPQSLVSTNQNVKPNTHSIKIISKDSIFGELSFFSGVARNSYARSLNLSTLYKIDRNKFISLVKENQEDFERFKMMQEQIKVLQDISFLFLECFICKNQGHIAKDCPLVHQKFDSQFITLKHNFSLFQERNMKIQRKQFKLKFNSRMNINKNINICNLLKQNIRYFNSKTDILFQSDYEIDSEQQETDNLYKKEQKTSSNCSSQSSQKEGSSSKSISEKFIFKSDRSINSVQKEQQASNNLKIVKSQIFIGKQPNLTRNQRDLDNQENLLHSEKQNKTEENIYININQSECYQKEQLLDRQENQLEVQEDNTQNNDLSDIQNNTNQGQYSRTQNTSKLSNSNIKDSSSHISVQEQNEEKQKNYQKKPTIKLNNKNQEDYISCNSNEDDNINLNHSFVSSKTFKNSKTAKSFKNKEFEKPQFEKILSKEIFNSYIAQSFALIHTQNQLNKFENSMSKLESQIQSISSQKVNLNQERNMQQYIKSKNPSRMFSTLSRKQNGSQELRLSDILKYDFDQNSKGEDSYKFQKEQKQTHKSIDVYDSNSQNQIDSSNSLKMLQKICKILSQKGTNIFNFAGQQQDEEKIVDNLISDHFDMIQSYKKFFPHNNFQNVIEQTNNFSLFKRKKTSNSTKSIKSRRKNNIFIKQNSIRKSLFFNQVQQIQNYSQTEYKKFRPSFLSYGVSQKNDTNFPKFYVF